MQLLVPPLEDCGLGDYGSKTGDVSTSDSRGRSVMSQGLQDKFGAMGHAWNQARTTSERSETAASSAAEQDTNEGVLEDEHQKKKRKVAIETALAIESEVQKWQRGIAELEAMLEEASEGVGGSSGSSSSSSSFLPEGEARGGPPEVVRFPSLPPIIPAEEGDLDGSSSGKEDESDD